MILLVFSKDQANIKMEKSQRATKKSETTPSEEDDTDSATTHTEAEEQRRVGLKRKSTGEGPTECRKSLKKSMNSEAQITWTGQEGLLKEDFGPTRSIAASRPYEAISKVNTTGSHLMTQAFNVEEKLNKSHKPAKPVSSKVKLKRRAKGLREEGSLTLEHPCKFEAGKTYGQSTAEEADLIMPHPPQ